jgi:hypothetical protein
MKQNKYSIAEYWDNRIDNRDNFWNGLFENKPINRDSVIINPVILNSYSNQMENGWVVYPNSHSVLGFLKFIYLPSAFNGLVERSSDYQYYFEEFFGAVLDSYKKDYPDKISLIEKMESFYYDLDDYWKLDNKDCFEAIKNWTDRFNTDWNEIRGTVLSFHVFRSPLETAIFIVDEFEDSLGIDSLEEDIGISKDEFLSISTDDIFENEFMKRRFTDILTNRLKITF